MNPESTRREREEAQAHARSCASCNGLIETHEVLDETEIPEPDEADLLQMRQSVLLSVRSEAATGFSRSPASSIADSLLRPFSGLMSQPAFVALTVLALLALGFTVGRWSGANPAQMATPESTAITSQVELAAARGVSGKGAGESPFSYSNVRLREVDAGRVELSFDVATHLELVRTKDDPLVAEVLVQSLVNQEPIGTRLDAIDAAEGLEPRVRDALVSAMLDDESLAVRLRAISKLTGELRGLADDTEVDEALLQVLSGEESVRMRLLAIEHLTRRQVSPQALRAALAVGRPEPGTAVYAKAEEYLRTF